jgi:hypothetical protein
VQIQLYRIPSKQSESHNIQRLLVPLYCILMALLGTRTPLLSLGKWGFHTFSHPHGGCVGKATMVRTTVVKTHGRQRELNPTFVEPPAVRHLPLEHACSMMCPPTSCNHRGSRRLLYYNSCYRRRRSIHVCHCLSTSCLWRRVCQSWRLLYCTSHYRRPMRIPLCLSTSCFWRRGCRMRPLQYRGEWSHTHLLP